MTSPVWCLRSNSRQGSSWVALSDNDTRSRSRSTSSTSTSTSWPTATTSLGWSTCFHDSSDTWTSPSTPPRSPNAPKVDERGREEPAKTDVQDQAALDDLDHRALDRAARGHDLLDATPRAL